MKEQTIYFGRPIHILCNHPLVSRVIKRVLAPSGHCMSVYLSTAQIQGFREHEYMLIIDTYSGGKMARDDPAPWVHEKATSYPSY